MLTGKLKGLGITVGSHDDPGVPIGGGFRRTSAPRTVIIPQAKSLGITGQPLTGKDIPQFTGKPSAGSAVQPAQTAQAVPAQAPVYQENTLQETPSTAPVSAPACEDLMLDIQGMGEFPCVYRYVRKGEGCIVLGLIEKRSYLPKKWEPGAAITAVRVAGDDTKVYFYTGMTFWDGQGNAAILVQLPDEETKANA